MAEKKEKKPSKFIGFFKRIGKFFRDTISEMKKVSWPSKKQVLNNTLVVLAVVLVASVIIVALDSLFGVVLALILKGAA